MLKRYWGIIAALVGLAAIGGGIGYGLVQEASYEQDAAQQFADYTKRSAHQIKQSCDVETAAKQAQCIKNAREKYAIDDYEKRHDAADLVAQRTSALWTSIMGVAALIGMGLSLVGVILVWVTFQETRRTNRIAARDYGRARLEAKKTLKLSEDGVLETRRIGEAQTRCYLTGVEAEIGYLNDGKAIVRPLIKNSGQSPARTVRVSGKVNHFAAEVSYRDSDPIPNIVHTGVDISAGSAEKLPFNVAINFSDEEKLHVAHGGQILITASVEIIGTDVFGIPVREEERFTAFLNQIPGPKVWTKLERSVKHHLQGNQ